MKKTLLSVSFLFFLISSCVKDKAIPNTDYPDHIARIINTKCSITGCHTATAKEAAGGLNLESWSSLFEGGNGGSVVIPYRPDQSWLMFYVNTDTNLGLALTPTMPFEMAPLSEEEYLTLKNWIASGAPDENSNIAFSGDPNREKFYVANQGCDLITVFDTKSKLAMRCIDAGASSQIESPHQIRVSPDGKYWYVIFTAGSVVQKFRAEDDSYIGSIDIGSGSWNTFTISPDGKKAFVVDWEDEGKIAYVDLENLSWIQYYQGSGLFMWPHGIAANASFTTLYVTAQYGNVIYKIDITNPESPDIENIVITPGISETFQPGTFDPHEVIVSPNQNRYFITCQTSNEVRVMDVNTDTLIAAIPVGAYPLEMAFSNDHPYLFVTCMEDPCSQSLCKGSVYVIDYNSLSIVSVMQEDLYQPHGILVDDENGIVVVASRNINADGPAPHHTSTCGGRNGFLQFFDLNTLEIIDDYKTEVSVDPYSIAKR